MATADDEGTERGPALFMRHGGGPISDELAERLAESLGLDEDEVADALEEVRDELGPPERLERTCATARCRPRRRRRSRRPARTSSPPPWPRPSASTPAEIEAALEEIRADVEAQLEERFAEFREEARAALVDRLDAAVEEGTLTEADKESVLKAYDEGVLDGPGGGPFGHFRFGDGPFGGDDEEPSTSS